MEGDEKKERKRFDFLPSYVNLGKKPELKMDSDALERMFTRVMGFCEDNQTQMLGMMDKWAQREPQVTVTTQPDVSKTVDQYSGHQTENLTDWLAQMEAAVKRYNWDDITYIESAGTRLSGVAKDWHRAIGRKATLKKDYVDGIKAAFNQPLTDRAWSEMMTKRNQNEKEHVSSYCYAKLALFARSTNKLSDQCAADWILSGLRSAELRNVMYTRFLNEKLTVDKLIVETISMSARMEDKPEIDKEKMKRDDSRRETSYSEPRESTRRDNGGRWTPQPSLRDRPYNSSNFPERGQQRRETIPNFDPRRMRKEDALCFRCHIKGHLSNECSQPPPPWKLNKSTEQPAKPGVTPKTDLTKQIVGYSLTPAIKTLSPDRMTIPIVANNQDIVAFIDPGAEISLVRADMIAPLKLQTEPWKGEALGGLAGSTYRPKLMTSFKVKIGAYEGLLDKVAIVPELPNAIVIGSDWKRKSHVAIVSTETNDCMLIPSSDIPHVYDQCSDIRRTDGPLVHFVVCNKDGSDSTTKIDAIRSIGEAQATDCINPQLGLSDFESKLESLALSETISNSTRDELKTILRQHEDVFSTHSYDIGFCDLIEHEIHLVDNVPVATKPYKLPRDDIEFLKTEVANLKAAGVIQESNSPYASPSLVVHNPANASTPKRFVVDFRRLNEKTIKDPFPMPDQKTILAKTAGYKYYSKIDVKKYFYHVGIREEDRKKTAFIVDDEQYEFLRTAQGLCNSPATLARAFNQVRQKAWWKLYVSVYFDDILVHTKDISLHLRVLDAVFGDLIRYGFRIDFSKCEFLMSRVLYLGMYVSANGLEVDPTRTDAILGTPKPKTAKAVKSFLGLLSYFREFIPTISTVIKPLVKLTRKNSDFNWTLECDGAFETARRLLVNPPILAPFDPTLPTIVHVDSSGAAFGAALMQVDGQGRERAIEYASKLLPEGDQKKHINELEAIAVHWAVHEKFRVHLLGLPKFTVWTDNVATSTILTKRHPNRRLARIALDLMDYNFSIHHKPGKSNVVADALSRRPDATIIAYTTLQPGITVAYHTLLAEDSRLWREQCDDDDIAPILELFQREDLSAAERARRTNYVVVDRLLYRKDGTSPHLRLVCPRKLRLTLLEHMHDLGGHMDALRTAARLKLKYFWKGLVKDVTEYVSGCEICQRMNSRTSQATGDLGAQSIPTLPFQVISIDHEGPFNDTDKDDFVVCFVDHLTRFLYTVVQPTRQSSDTIGALLQFTSTYGIPEEILTDCDTTYLSTATQRFFDANKITHRTSIANRHQSNGIVERTIGKFLQVLRKMLLDDDGSPWEQQVRRATLYVILD